MNFAENPISPVLVWPGGKRRMLKYIIPAIAPHRCYVELFAGGLAVLLAKPRSEVEVINDINRDLVTLYRVLKHHAPALECELCGLINSREDFIASKQPAPAETDVQHAARWLFRNRLSFGGDGDSFGVVTQNGGGAQTNLRRVISQAYLVGDRLHGVVIEHLSWERCLEIYDRTHTFFFLDPPYVDCAQRTYQSFTQDDMKAIAARLRKLKANWLLTVNDSPANRSLFAFGRIRRITRQRLISNKGGPSAKYAELVVTRQ